MTGSFPLPDVWRQLNDGDPQPNDVRPGISPAARSRKSRTAKGNSMTAWSVGRLQRQLQRASSGGRQMTAPATFGGIFGNLMTVWIH
jgi:hypothetical protein